MTVWVGVKYGFNISASSTTPSTSRPATTSHPQPYGLQYKNKIDFISLSIALVLGTAGLPHVLMRFYTVPTSKEARRSVVWAIWLIGLFYLFTLVLGYGAQALVGPDAIKAAPGGQLGGSAAGLPPRRRVAARCHLRRSPSRRSSRSSPA
jgi:cation/acetate symporter